MCGIAGILRIDGGPIEAGPLERMIGALDHRGPDGSGIHLDEGICLAHRRLSILDPTPAGAQPMLRGRCALIHNGEVYNYLELAAELRDHGEQIATGTDTEVILAAYRVWGVDAVSRFNGMFAFALWDPDRKRLLLARDRMGVKPLYLRRTGRSLAFASELSALVAGGRIDDGDDWTPRPHLGAVHDFLARGWTDHSTATFLDGVTALPAAHTLIVEAGRERLVRYWGPPQLADDGRPAVRGADEHRDERLVEEFRATFDSSVRLRLRSDVPIGTCLSGGLDSSSIVATVAELIAADGGGKGHEQVPRLGFHARFPSHGIDESPFAEMVAERAGIRLVHTTPTGAPLLATVLPVLRAQGEPYGGGSVNAQYAVMAAARREGIKVLLDGQGADELLGGYLPYLGLRTAGLLFSGNPFDALAELKAQVQRGPYSASGVLLAAVNEGIPRGALEAIRDRTGGAFGIQCAAPLRRESAMQRPPREPGTFLAARLWHALTSQGLPTLLRYEDRNSMAFGIEARVPFLDVHLVELAVRLPDRLRIDRGTTKVALRRAMKDRLPQAVNARRDKLGFVAPQQAWLADGAAQVAGLLRGGQVVQRGWVAPREVERVLAQGMSGGRRTEHLWRLFITEAWLRMLWPDAGGSAGSATWAAGLAGESGDRAMRGSPVLPEAVDPATTPGPARSR